MSILADLVVPAVAGDPRRPLADGRRRALFLQTREPEETALNVAVAYRVDGALDPDRLRAALAQVAAEHEILRTTYGFDAEGEPFEELRADTAPSWQVQEIAELPEASRARRVEVLARRELARPFDLAVEAPLRVTLIRTGAAEFVLVLVAHAIAWDEESAGVFGAALEAAYRSGGEETAAVGTPGRAIVAGTGETGQPGRDAAGPEAVRAEPGRATAVPDDPSDAALDFWRSALTPLPDPVELPAKPVTGPARRIRRVTRRLPAGLLDRVPGAETGHPDPAFGALGAAFAALLHRYTATTDLLLAVPVNNRDAASADRIGFFGNTILLRTRVRSAEPFTELAASFSEAASAAFAHANVGIEHVVRVLNPRRAGARDGLDRLARIAFSVRTAESGFALGAATATPLELGSRTAAVPLRIDVVRDGADARVQAEYRDGRFDDGLIAQLLTHYVRLLADAVAAPELAVGELDLLGADERERLRAQSHGELVPTPPSTLVALFEHRVRQAPAAPALLAPSRTGDRTIGYAELDRRANRLARELIAREIGAEDLVALRLATSVEYVVAVLAVLKAGAAYLPIDPSYPQPRIDYVLADAAPRLILDPESLAAVERAAAALASEPLADTERARPLRPANLAYVIYTSGSTGRPKGVPVAHAAIAEHLDGFCAEWGMTADDRLLQSSSIGFDASLLDIFVTFTVGACLVVPEPDALRDLSYTAEIIARCRVTVLHMVPSTLSTLLLLPEVSDWRALRRVPVGGEALLGEVADRFAAVFDAELRNHYGPTEAVVCATHQVVAGPQGAGIVPIGVPNRNVHVHLLDAGLRPVPAGVIGEIYLGGAQLARGYLNRAGLAAERFVADPFLAGGRLYRTGDLARRNLAGEIEFVGRADDQVKVRGHRIELGEVQAAIAAHPAVGHCAVVAVGDPARGTTLAAYLVPAGNGMVLEPEQVRARAAVSLPEYMLPSSFTVLERIPLTEHGKLDRAALPAPAPVRSPVSREPATGTEIRLAALFAEIFGAERVGADDSFFELGGHSLLAGRLVALIRAEFGVAVDVRAPFDTPTVAGLAAAIEAAPLAASSLPAPTRQLRRPERIPLSVAQEVRWRAAFPAGAGDGQPLAARAGALDPAPRDTDSLATVDADSLGSLPEEPQLPAARSWSPTDSRCGVPFAVRFEGRLDRAALLGALRDTLARHEILRTRFAPGPGGAPVPRRVPVEEIEIPVRTVGSAAELNTALAEAAAAVPDPVAGPGIRPVLVTTTPETHVLVLTAHHLVADHWSFRTVLRDLAPAYRARLRGDTAHRPLPELSFTDYALWQRAAAGQLHAQAEYWRAALAGLPAPTGLATDLPRREPSETGSHTARFTIDPVLRGRLRALAEGVGASEFMLYQAAVAVLLHQHGAGTDIALGAAIAGRTDPALADLVGPVANTLVLRTDLTGDPTPRAVLERSRATALAAYGNQDVPVECVPGAAETFGATLDFREQDWSAEARFGEEIAAAVLPLPGDPALRDIGFAFHCAQDGGFDAAITVRASLFRPASAELFAGRARRLLTAFADTPDRPLSRLGVGTGEERERVLREWSAGVEPPFGPAAPGLLWRGRMFPGQRPALRCGGETLDYQSLFQRVDESEDTVPATGIAAADIVRLLVAFDAAAQSDTPITLAAGCTGTGRVVVAPAAVAAAVADRRAVVTDCAPGSTDRARGSVDVRLVVAPAPTVAVLVEVLAGLVDGATVVVAEPRRAAAFLDAERVTHVVAAAGTVLGRDGALRDGPNRWAEVRRWDLWGEGGPSESECARIAFDTPAEFPARAAGTVGYAPAVTVGAVARGPVDGSGRVRPIPGARVYVLDPAGQPCAPGVPGAVYVGGAALGVADAADARFEDDPLQPGERRYRTGDTAHWTVDGWLKFA
ncbi:non-ribosomal peptide synthetase [Nocardia asteroides]|uniref:non-ribosomal peptide synthetase n=1 Tax=Nocardia asteroides TaxID=1824 RepID=UPI001E5C8C4E|nr:non-ribosomal peptide synthetase [Nocardia asteroides]UGT59956.1 amino acid adenylation domain-containing protein [Nocardia asteroides]